MTNSSPNISPQSHIANLRTNPNWTFNYKGETIKGRIYWYSDPLILLNSCNINECIGETAKTNFKTLGKLDVLAINADRSYESFSFTWIMLYNYYYY